MLFLQAYQNWISVHDNFVDEGLAKGWCDHHAHMLANNFFTLHLSAWKLFDKTLQTQFMDNPFPINPNHPTYFAMFKRAHNSTILYNDLPSVSTSFSHIACPSYHARPPSDSL